MKMSNTLDLAIGWLAPVIFDTVIFSLTIFKRLCEFSVLRGGILSVLSRDGTYSISLECTSRPDISYYRHTVLWVTSSETLGP